MMIEKLPQPNSLPSTPANLDGCLEAVILGVGVPIDDRFDEIVRQRARDLAQQFPGFFRTEDDSTIWMSAANDSPVFDNIYNWVHSSQIDGQDVSSDQLRQTLPPSPSTPNSHPPTSS